MRALVVLLFGLAFLLPGVLLLQLPRGPWSLLFDAAGLTLGAIGVMLILASLAMALWRIWRQR